MEAKDMQLRSAGPEDIEKLVRLRLDFFTAVGDHLPPAEEEQLAKSLRDYYARNLGLNFFAFLIEADEKIVASAFMLLVDRPPSPAVPSGLTAQVLNVLTCPGYRRLGLGLRLISRLIEEARRLNVSRIDLSATPDGEKLYRRLGFGEQNHHTPLQLSLTGGRHEPRA